MLYLSTSVETAAEGETAAECCGYDRVSLLTLLIDRHGVTVDALSTMDTRALARVASWIRELAEQKEPAFSTRQIIEACFPTALVTGGKLPDGVHELVSRRDEGPVIVYSRALSGPQQRFAIAHALAHLIFDGDEASARPGCAGRADCEERADAFAAELLAPLEELRPYVGRWPSLDAEEHELYLDMVDEIASHFVLPAMVIDEQIRRLVRITNQ